MLKILQARLQQYVNRELPDVQTGIRKGRGTRDKIVNTHWLIEKARVPKDIYSSWEICIQVKKQQLELEIEQQTCSKMG